MLQKNYQEKFDDPVAYYIKRCPRFIGKGFDWRASPIKLEARDDLSLLSVYRELSFYQTLETVREYEISNAYAYEAALRNDIVKSFLNTNAPNGLEYSYSKEWIDEVCRFENNRVHFPYRKRLDNSILKCFGIVEPPRTLPEIEITLSREFIYPVRLNMYLPQNEVIALLDAYHQKVADMKEGNHYYIERSDITFKEENALDELRSNIKIFTKISNILDEEVKEMVNKNLLKIPNLRTLKIADVYFAYDMRSMGFKADDVAEAIYQYRAKLLYRLNKDNDKAMALLDEKDRTPRIFELAVAKTDGKTVRKWQKELQTILDTDRGYELFVAPRYAGPLSVKDYLY